MPDLALSDGIIFLRQLTMADAAAHLAGEDDLMARFASGGRSTPATVEAFIRDNAQQFQNDGPRRAFGVFDCATNTLIGFVEANLTILSDPDKVNISYGIFNEWRGRGLALRAIDLMERYLRAATRARQVVLRISPENAQSLRVAEKGRFTFLGVFDEPKGPMAHYVRHLKRDD